jgi:medium-chain acyl-[acyl-carrier-protein] hydrolase
LSEPLLGSSEELVASLAVEVLPLLERPAAFLGHSLGALIAFELARQIDESRRANLRHLFVSARAAPQLPDPGPHIHTLPQADFLCQIAQLDGTPTTILEHAELMELLYPILRADFAVNETYVYRPGPRLDCPISALGGLRDQLVDRAQLEAWRAQTSGPFALRMFPGQHFFVNELRPLLLRIVTQDLLPALSRTPGPL